MDDSQDSGWPRLVSGFLSYDLALPGFNGAATNKRETRPEAVRKALIVLQASTDPWFSKPQAMRMRLLLAARDLDEDYARRGERQKNSHVYSVRLDKIKSIFDLIDSIEPKGWGEPDRERGTAPSSIGARAPVWTVRTVSQFQKADSDRGSDLHAALEKRSFDLRARLAVTLHFRNGDKRFSWIDKGSSRLPK